MNSSASEFYHPGRSPRRRLISRRSEATNNSESIPPWSHSFSFAGSRRVLCEVENGHDYRRRGNITEERDRDLDYEAHCRANIHVPAVQYQRQPRQRMLPQSIDSIMSSSQDARDVSSSEDRVDADDQPTISVSGRPSMYMFETTHDGDVVVHDEIDKPNNSTMSSWQSPGIRSVPKRHNRHHSRNLSAHFFDATKLTDDDDEAQVATTFDNKPEVSPAVGQKHRRMFSGDVSNPNVAHRRINSIGNSSAVDRFPRPRSRHRREDSAGLDILSAAAGVTTDELADAAGARTNPIWEGPAAGPHHTRLSSLDFYEYGSVPPSTRQHPVTAPPPGPMKPPPARGYPHHPPPHSHAHPQHHGYMPPPHVASRHPHHPPTVMYHHHHPRHASPYHPPPHHASPHHASPHHPPPHHPPPHHASPHHPPPHHPPPHHHYPPPSYYPPPHSHVPPPRPAYPVQYSHRAPPPDVYKTQLYPPPVEEPSCRQPSPAAANYADDRIESDEKLFTNKGRTPSPTAPRTALAPALYSTTSETENNRRDRADTTTTAAFDPAQSDPLLTVRTAPTSLRAHHRKLSSCSSIGAIITSSMFDAIGDQSEPVKGHHRSTSSSVSFLQGLDVLEGSDVMFLHHLHASTPAYGAPPTTSASDPPPPPSHYGAPPQLTSLSAVPPPPAYGPPQPTGSSAGPQPAFYGPPHPNSSSSVSPPSYGPPLTISSSMPPMPPLGAPSTESHNGLPPLLEQPMHEFEDSDGTHQLAAGGTSKRVRRKCTLAGCPNRVVQGGLCIAHGARRKVCNHPGCTKNVKKAGMCSTHGPARRRCDGEGCNKVAVQGGRCIAHGAKKKMCSVDNCKKQAILSGMCKKHHDKWALDPNAPPMTCVVIASGSGSGSGQAKPAHKRGLSIFQDLSADAVGNLLDEGELLHL
jgi:hypothetical protein